MSRKVLMSVLAGPPAEGEREEGMLCRGRVGGVKPSERVRGRGRARGAKARSSR
jgi:hypothetical protein